MKKMIPAFLLGVFVTVCSFNVFAAVQTYTLNKYETPVYIQNVKYPTDALPVLTLYENGGDNTYVPLRNFSEMMGASVNFDSANGKIDITLDNKTSTSNSNTVDSTASATPTTTPQNTDTVSLRNLTSEYNSTYRLNIYKLNDKHYVNADDIEEIYFDDDYSHSHDDYDFETNMHNQNHTITLEYNNKNILSNISAIRTTDDDDYLIEYDYFVNTIYPIIK